MAWVDPVLGARLQLPETGRWRLSVRGEVGGFGIGFDFAWQVLPSVGYDIPRQVEVAASYRVIGVDHENDEGFRWDVRTLGARVGLTFRPR